MRMYIKYLCTKMPPLCFLSQVHLSKKYSTHFQTEFAEGKTISEAKRFICILHYLASIFSCIPIPISDLCNRYTYILVVAGWRKGLYLEKQTMGTSGNIYLAFLIPQWGTKERHEVTLKFLSHLVLISRQIFYSSLMCFKKLQLLRQQV